jgi:hypothetical protein
MRPLIARADRLVRRARCHLHRCPENGASVWRYLAGYIPIFLVPKSNYDLFQNSECAVPRCMAARPAGNITQKARSVAGDIVRRRSASGG